MGLVNVAEALGEGDGVSALRILIDRGAKYCLSARFRVGTAVLAGAAMVY